MRILVYSRGHFRLLRVKDNFVVVVTGKELVEGEYIAGVQEPITTPEFRIWVNEVIAHTPRTNADFPY